MVSPLHCGDQGHLGLRLGYVPALACGSFRVSDQGTALRASDLYIARAIMGNHHLNPFNNVHIVLFWNISISYITTCQLWCLVLCSPTSIVMPHLPKFVITCWLTGASWWKRFEQRRHDKGRDISNNACPNGIYICHSRTRASVCGHCE